jgi:hypothetical protein
MVDRTRREGKRLIDRGDRWDVVGGTNEQLVRTVVFEDTDGKEYTMCLASDRVTAHQIAYLPRLLDLAEDLLWQLRNVVVPEEASNAWHDLSMLVLYYRRGSDMKGWDLLPDSLSDLIEVHDSNLLRRRKDGEAD